MIGLIEIILLSVLVICFIIQMIFYWIVLAKPYYYMQSVKKGNIRFIGNYPPVSVIIYVKNRFYDLQNFLPAILEQDYPQFEVIIINDEITEKNKNTLFRLQAQYENLYFTNIPDETRNVSREKLGLTLGIKAAKYDCLLFTEADSHTRSNNWIRLMARHFGKNKTVVLGMSAKEEENSFFRKFISYDYFFSNLQKLSMALFNHPYAGIGRNLLYSKTQYNEQKGYVRHHSRRRVEADLFINNIVAESDAKVELSPESVIMTDLNTYDWKQEKINKTFTNRFYKAGPVVLGSLEFFSGFFFIISVISCFIISYLNPQAWPYVFGLASGCYLTRLLSQLFVINKTASSLELKKYYLTVPLFDFMQMMSNIYFFMYRFVRKK